jgi:hypothetical protein
MSFARELQQRDALRWPVAVDDLDGTLHRQLDPKPTLFMSWTTGAESPSGPLVQRSAQGPSPATRRVDPRSRSLRPASGTHDPDDARCIPDGPHARALRPNGATRSPALGPTHLRHGAACRTRQALSRAPRSVCVMQDRCVHTKRPIAEMRSASYPSNESLPNPGGSASRLWASRFGPWGPCRSAISGDHLMGYE